MNATTKPVRIAVLIDRKGNYEAHGSDDIKTFGDANACASWENIDHDNDDGNYHWVWVEADVPLPEDTVVRGEVV